MKKFLLAAALVIISALTMPADAQIKFGPKVGVNISHFSLNDGLDNLKSENITSFTGGLMAEFTVPVIGIGIDASVMYTRKGSKLKHIFEGKNKCATPRIDYIEIPVNLKYKFSLPVVGSILSPYLFAGPSFAFRVGDNFKDQYNNKDFETSINVGVGVELLKRVQVAAQYGWGLNNTVKGVGNAMTGKSRAWTVTAAYLF